MSRETHCFLECKYSMALTLFFAFLASASAFSSAEREFWGHFLGRLNSISPSFSSTVVPILAGWTPSNASYASVYSEIFRHILFDNVKQCIRIQTTQVGIWNNTKMHTHS